ncbi:hypothetical protein [Leptospira stimsonii]|uniref:Uncharacterized protein n=1 Tax=Leptospira stimsonii TaxID=2202203 RepID=A0A396YQL6_9LEPT|nr:hypothetical protein [Leptospira stimsonii]RHX83624.1 hypothetical protein DLM75_23855 [Leptospira stimsonii]
MQKETILRGKMKNITIHFYYTSGILLTIIIILLTIQLSTDSNTVNYISFGATLTSLFLGLIAIFYSIVSNSTLTNSLQLLSNASLNMSSASTTIETNASHLKEVINQIPTIVGKVEAKVDQSNLLLQNISQKNDNKDLEVTSKGENTTSTKKVEINEALSKQILSASSTYGLFSIYICYKSFTTKKAFDLKELLKLGKHESLYLYFFGYTVAMGSIGVLQTAINDTIFNTYQMEKHTVDLIEKALDQKIKQGAEAERLFQSLKEAIDKYFK